MREIYMRRWRETRIFSFNAGVFTFREFAMNEPILLATLHQAVLEFLRGRDDAALFGAQAVNAYVPEPRMTQDVDILSTRAAELASELQAHLHHRFHAAIRVREIGDGKGYRVFQVSKSGNRHLADVRPVETLPGVQRIMDILVVTPPELIAEKVIAYAHRRGSPKSGTDWRDIALLLLTFPELKSETGAVVERLCAANADQIVFAAWNEFVAQEFRAADNDEY